MISFLRVQKSVKQISDETVGRILIWMYVYLCQVCKCVWVHSRPLFYPQSVGVFLECHLPPNCNNIVEQRLFTNHQEDGTNFHHFLLSRLSVSLWRLFQFELLIRSRQQAATSWFWQQLWILCSTQVVVSRGIMKFLWNHLFPRSLNYIFIIAAWTWQ